MHFVLHALRFWKVSSIMLGFLYFLSIPMADACPDGMRSYWRLEGDGPLFYDSINRPLGNNASCASECPVSIPDGAVGKAVRFSDSDTSGLEVPGNQELIWSSTQSFSFELWIRFGEATGDYQVLMGRGDENFFWNISILPDNTVRFTMQDFSGAIVLNSKKEISSFGSALGLRWHHVAVTRNGQSGETQMFVDGSREDRVVQNLQGALASDLLPLVIAWSGDEHNALRFNGSLDEVAIYNRELSAKEIRSHYFLARKYCDPFNTPLKIMPMGDSITFDNYSGDNRPLEDRTSYRYDLWLSLSKNAYECDFVGSEQTGQSIPGFDPDNAGFPGILPSELAGLLATSYNSEPEPISPGYYVGGVTSDTPYLSNFSCDVVLLHVGTVGLFSTAVIPGYIQGVRDILAEIDRQSPRCTVLIARIIHKVSEFTTSDPNAENSATHLFNEALERMVQDRITAGDKLILVDMEDGAGLRYILGKDMIDDLHPSESGYSKMADLWFANLSRIMPPVVVAQDDGGGGGGGCFIQSTTGETRSAFYPDGLGLVLLLAFIPAIFCCKTLLTPENVSL